MSLCRKVTLGAFNSCGNACDRHAVSSVRDIPWRRSSQGFPEGQSPGHLVPAPPVCQNPNKNKAEVVQHKLCLQSSFGMSLFYNLGNDGNPSKVCGPRQQTRANLEYSQS